MMTFDRDEIIDLIIEFDEHLHDNKYEYDIRSDINLVIGGGSAFLIKRLSNRRTVDIDTVSKLSHLENVMKTYFINFDMLRVAFLPEDYMDRIDFIDLNTKVLNVYTLSVYDLIVSKLVTTRPKDFEDICGIPNLQNLDIDFLDKLVNKTIYTSQCNEQIVRENYRIFKYHNFL